MRRSKQRSEELVTKQKARASFKTIGMYSLWKLTSPRAGLCVGLSLCIFSAGMVFILTSHFKDSLPGWSIIKTDDYHRHNSKKEDLQALPKETNGTAQSSDVKGGQPVIKHGRFKDRSYLKTNSRDTLDEQSAKISVEEVNDELKEANNMNSHENNYVLLQLVNAYKGSKFADNFYHCIKSILKRTKIELTFLLTVDELSKKTAEETLKNVASELSMQTVPSSTYLLIEEVNKNVYPYTKALQELFSSGQGAYYSHAIFFIGPVLHKILPSTVKKLVMLDTDLQFRTDIQDLFALFHKMSPRQIMALATDQQPVYRHVLWSYRQKHPGTKVGDPPPDGKTGFNSGVKLINLEEMRNSQLYNNLLNKEIASQLAVKYEFKGHLGDQDFYSLASFDHPDLFYTLPCQWNRQLCTWWRDNGYKEVFDLYFKCSPPFHVIHGNCNTPIPAE